MKEIKKELLKGYYVFRTTKLINEDIKLLKKMNNLMQKYTNTNKDKYRLETINILKITSNVVTFSKELIDIIKKKLIEEKHREIFDEIIVETFVNG